ncbi:phosphodiester glycosidase family protein [bacterium]|nr:phosphodiester glycosidase family protein [candidate division CSSED10-310 bacterium]
MDCATICQRLVKTAFSFLFSFGVLYPAMGLDVAERIVIDWKIIAEGMEYAEIQGSHYCRSGSPIIAAVRVSPDHWRFETGYYKDLPSGHRLSANSWRHLKNAVFVFNAGLYAENYRHLGLLFSRGRNLGSKLHGSWKGLFVAHPIDDDLPSARIIDLQNEKLLEKDIRYKEAVQSLMLFDRDGNLRVRRTENQARRTAIAESKSGKILIFVSRGEYTLWEFAEILMRLDADIMHAMSLDGGAQSQLSIELPQLSVNIPETQITIPAVILGYSR